MKIVQPYRLTGITVCVRVSVCICVCMSVPVKYVYIHVSISQPIPVQLSSAQLVYMYFNVCYVLCDVREEKDHIRDVHH